MSRSLKVRIKTGAAIMGLACVGLCAGSAQSATDPVIIRPVPSTDVALALSMPVYPPFTLSDSGVPIKIADDEPIIAGSPLFAPLKWAGLYFGTDQRSRGYVCTAQFITQRVLLTAAHCVYNQDTGEYYPISDRTSGFLLQYQNRSFTKRYHVVCRAVWKGYENPLKPGEDLSKPETMSKERQQQYLEAKSKAWQWDYAFVLVDGDSLTGHYNYKINAHANGANATGYPAAIMGGEVIQRVPGDVIREQDVAYSQGDQGNEQVLWHGIPDFTGGASGGAWVFNFSSEEKPENNILIGLNSYHDRRKLGLEFSPFFTDAFENLLHFTANGCKS